MSRTADGRLIGAPPDTFHGFTDAERNRAIEFLAELGGYAWPDGRIIYTPQVMLDAEKVHRAFEQQALQHVLELGVAVQAEREECAKVAVSQQGSLQGIDDAAWGMAEVIAENIRARGKA